MTYVPVYGTMADNASQKVRHTSSRRGKTYYDSITEVMNEDINKLKSFDKVEFILMKSGMLSLIWAYLKLSLLKNRWLLKHKRKDELKLCYKFINKLYKLR
jgi:hypothetical protein